MSWSSVELDQILEYQAAATISPRLHKDAAFRKNDVRLDGFRHCVGSDLGSDRGRIERKAFDSRVFATHTSMPLRANALLASA